MARINTSSLQPLTKRQYSKHLRTGDITQKMAAAAIFQSELINALSNEEKTRISSAGLKMLSVYFEAYVDNLARSNHKMFHHVYEPNMTGDKRSRLFESSISEAGKPTLTYNFKKSRVPSDSGYVFENKAYVMENGIPVTIKATNARYLKFKYKGKFRTKKQVFVANPGGLRVQNAFIDTFDDFMKKKAKKVLTDLGFFERIEKGIEKESRVILARISAGKIEGMAASASSSARNISRSLRRGL